MPFVVEADWWPPKVYPGPNPRTCQYDPIWKKNIFVDVIKLRRVLDYPGGPQVQSQVSS